MEGKKSNVVFFDKEMREEARRLGFDKLTLEELKKVTQQAEAELRKTPEGRAFMAEMIDKIAEGTDIEWWKRLRKEYKENIEDLE